jgi:hypothetical protein
MGTIRKRGGKTMAKTKTKSQAIGRARSILV